jgi:hypothetical protein
VSPDKRLGPPDPEEGGAARENGVDGETQAHRGKAKENEMYVSIDRELSRHRCEEIRREVAANRLAGVARANRERRPYVVRDLSWELARYLDAEGFSASASTTPKNAGGN